MDLPVADGWFRVEPVAPGLTLLVERHLDPFFESNIWVELVCAGHSRPFGRQELVSLIDGELRRRS